MKATNNVTPCAKAPARRTVKTRGAISCITIERTAHGRSVGDEHFDVPAEDYGDGNVTGYRLASEFMDAIKTGKPGFDSLQVIADACKALKERDFSTSGDALKSRRGAAVGFLRTLEDLLGWVARAGIHERYIERSIEHYAECERKAAQTEKDERANFARRMEVAKAAKAQARRAINQIARASRVF